MPDFAALRSFLSTTTAPVVAIETEDLLALCDAAERALAIPPRVPALRLPEQGVAA